MKIKLWMATDSDNITTLHSGKPKRKPCGWAYGGKTLLILGKNVPYELVIDEEKEGEYVKYDDIKHLLKQPNESECYICNDMPICDKCLSE
jgi:hypothetical protein